MQTQFKRHQRVQLLIDPDPEYIEHQPDYEKTSIKKGMTGRINILLPNGEYHVEIIDEKSGETLAYVKISEEYLKSIE